MYSFESQDFNFIRKIVFGEKFNMKIFDFNMDKYVVYEDLFFSARFGNTLILIPRLYLARNFIKSIKFLADIVWVVWKGPFIAQQRLFNMYNINVLPYEKAVCKRERARAQVSRRTINVKMRSNPSDLLAI